ncbi:hypothetical protein JW868_01710 [Candidatus Woesearchaeota archaeon]|nr:hypothetical protein [Candidatus Woesearchaeota archaeon]
MALEAIQLSNNETLSDLKVGGIYVATYREGLFYLNYKLKTKVNRGNYKEGRKYPVHVTSVSPPDQFRIEVIYEPFKTVNPSTLSGLTLNDKGQVFSAPLMVLDVKRRAALTLVLTDGTANIKCYSKADFYPFLEKGKIVDASLRIRFSEQALEGEIVSLKKPEFDVRELRMQIQEKHKRRCATDTEKLLLSDNAGIMEKMKSRIVRAAERIRKAVFEHQPIVVRHHDDADGYCGALALEAAVMPLLKIEHSNTYNQFSRASSNSPWYELSEASRDTQRFDNPLIVIVDNGSSVSDVHALQVASGKADIVVIDHHTPVKDGSNEKYICVHLNPYLFGFDSSICAGMLCSEVANFINSKTDVKHIPAIAGFFDKSSGPVFEKSKEISGMGADEALKLSWLVDYIGRHVKYIDGLTILNEIIIEKKFKQYMDMFWDYIEKQLQDAEKTISKFMKEKMVNGVKIVSIDLSSAMKRGDYPPPGKFTGLMHARFKDQNQNVLSLGIADDYLTIRSSIAGFDINDLIENMKEDFPFARIEGGGHPMAGSIKMVPASKDMILKKIEEYIARQG